MSTATIIKGANATRKKVDARVRTLIENNVKRNHRSLICIVGDGGKDQVVNLHYMLSKARVKARPSVLWCYKNDLGFSTHRKKRMRQIKKMVQRGLYDPDKDDPFDLFVASTDIRWAYYRDSHKVLGHTYGMCVIQDFESLTPNLLARTVETVEGGGIVVLLLRTMDSLKQLYSMTMDVHSRFRTEAHSIIKPRFNERFILSLASCSTCVVLDDELNILPISKHVKKIKPLEVTAEEAEHGMGSTAESRELSELKSSLNGTQPAYALVSLSKTLDQAKSVLTFIDAVSEKSMKSTVALTAARGRGKSAAMGIAIASAVAYGYSNIFVTSPTPENLGTVFQFFFKALDALKYKEHVDYEIVQSTNAEFGNAVVRVNLFHDHRQTVQYIQPKDHAMLSQAELVCIDEAAAIPLPVVKALIGGNHLVFLSSTVNGYEGTGRSLSLKLLDSLRKKQAASSNAQKNGGDWRTNAYMYKKSAKSRGNGGSARGGATVGRARALKEITLDEPIRYGAGDPVEDWLHRVLCLDVTKLSYRLLGGTPHPSDCELFAVDRDTLFSHHKVCETFLQRIMSLYVSSHYKNTPNDLQLLSDAPAHRIFVLLAKKQTAANADPSVLPDILCVLQVALEGGITRKHAQAQLAQGTTAAGDLIPWVVSQQFQDTEFSNLNGARVVRICTHPDVTRMGYGKRAVELLAEFYQGSLLSIDKDAVVASSFEGADAPLSAGATNLRKEKLKPRKALRPLLVPLHELPPPRLHYVGVSYGLTQGLFSFWSKLDYSPLYVRQTANDLTGEHTCVMVRPLKCGDVEGSPEEGWINGFASDFQRRYLALLGISFRHFASALALSLCDAAPAGAQTAEAIDSTLGAKELSYLLSPHDVKRLEAYARNMVDFHLVADLLPKLSSVFLRGKFGNGTKLSNLQRCLLVGMGLQGKCVEDISIEMDLPVSQLLAMFNKAVRKLSSALKTIEEKAIDDEMRSSKTMKKALRKRIEINAGAAFAPLAKSLQVEQTEDEQRANATLQKQQKELLASLDLEEFAVDGQKQQDWEKALDGAKGTLPASLSVKGKAKKRKANVDAFLATEEKKKRDPKRRNRHSRKKR